MGYLPPPLQPQSRQMVGLSEVVRVCVCVCVCVCVERDDSSIGKESACIAGDPVLIPLSGRSTGEGIGYPLQYCWASLVAQLKTWRSGGTFSKMKETQFRRMVEGTGNISKYKIKHGTLEL